MLVLWAILFCGVAVATKTTITVASSTVALTFDVTATSVRIVSISAGAEFGAAERTDAPLFSCTVLNGTAPRLALSADDQARWLVAASLPSPGRAQFDFVYHSCCSVSVEVRSSGPDIRIAASWSALHAGLQLLDLSLAVALGGGSSDALLTPRGFGQVVDNCFATPQVTDYAYAGTESTMQVFALLSERRSRSLYLATHDPSGTPKTFHFRHGIAGDLQCALFNRSCSGAWSVAMPSTDLSVATWKMAFPLVLRGLDGSDWFDAALVYRRFAASADWQTAPRLPSRLQSIDIALNSGWSFHDVLNVTQGLSATVLQDAIEARALFPAASIILHWYVWYTGAANFDMGYPFVFGTPRLDMAKTVAQIQQQLNITVMPYINGRSVDTTMPSYKRHAGQMIQSLSANGSLFVDATDYGNFVPLATACPQLSWWTNQTIPDYASSLANLGVGALYIDQTAAGQAMPCFSTSHGHPLGGGSSWIDGNRKLLLRSARYLPVVTESEAEVFVGAADAHLTVASCVVLPNIDGRVVPLFQSVYANVTTIGRIYEAADFASPDHACAKTAQLYLYGSVLGWMSWHGLLGVSSALRASHDSVTCFNRLIEWRQLVRPWFAGRRAQDFRLVNAASLPSIPTLFGVYDAVQTAAWTIDGSAIALLLTNSVAKQLPVQISYAVSTQTRAVAYLRGGRTLPLPSTSFSNGKFEWNTTIPGRDGLAIVLE
jgi:hypothetical protein